MLPALAWADQLQDAQSALNNRDYPTALKLLQPLADQGNVEAQRELGGMYECDCGMDPDYTKAAKWFRKAADQGDTRAQMQLGALYATGYGVKKDPKETIKWWGKAAALGDSKAQYALGEMYKAGAGVKQDNVQAYMWYSLADAFGEENTSIPLDDIAVKMTHDQIAEAKSLVAQWKSDHPQLHPSLKRYSIAFFFAIFLLPAILAASLKGPQQKFPFPTRIFTWVAFSLLLFMPLFLVCSQALVSPVSERSWIKAVLWMFGVFSALSYARMRCTSDRLPYIDGLMFVVSSMSGVWGGLRIILTLPLLVLIILISVAISIFYDLIGKPTAAPIQYHKTIGLIYKNRLRQ